MVSIRCIKKTGIVRYSSHDAGHINTLENYLNSNIIKKTFYL